MNAAAEVEISTGVNSDGPILFFDGGCALCHGAVRQVLRWERPGDGALLKFAPLEGSTATDLRGTGRLPASLDAVVLLDGADGLRGEEALGRTLELIGRPGWATLFRLWPAFLRRWGYRVVARHRTRWFGRTGHDCPLPADPARMLP